MKNKKGWTKISTAGKIFIGVCLMVMVLMVFVNAVARYGFKYNFPVFEELSKYLFVWVSFLGAMLAYSEGKHVGIDMLTSRLHGASKLVIKILAEIVIMVCLLVMLKGAWGYFSLTWRDPSPSAGIPYGMISGMAIVLAIFMIIITIRDIIRIIKSYKKGEYAKKEDV